MINQKESDVRSASRDVYDDWHNRLDVDTEADSPWHTLLKASLDPDRDIAGRRMLDIGCGRGGFALWLARHTPGPQAVVGCDFSPAAVAKAAAFTVAKPVQNLTWQVADIQKLDQFADGEFDTITSTETIEHVLDPPLAVRQLARVLKPGGRLFLTTPNYFSSIGLYRIYCWVRGKKFDEGGQPICHPNIVFRTRRWVRDTGIRVVCTSGVGHYLPFPGRPPIRLGWMEHPRLLMRWIALHSLVVGEKPSGQ